MQQPYADYEQCSVIPFHLNIGCIFTNGRKARMCIHNEIVNTFVRERLSEWDREIHICGFHLEIAGIERRKRKSEFARCNQRK